MRRIISILLENESGALSRVIGLFAQRGYNVDTLTVAPTDDNTLSRLTLTTQGNDHMVEQIVKQLHKLINTVKVVHLTEDAHVARELMLIKIKPSDSSLLGELKNCVEIFRGRIIDVTTSTYTVELTGDSDKLDAFIDTVRGMGLIEVVRSGVSGVSRGDKFLRV
jgi:acetolactate synthase-1/3 small subunit